MVTLSDQAKAAKREYHRAWRARNKDKVREINRRYWEKKAAEKAKVNDEPAESC